MKLLESSARVENVSVYLGLGANTGNPADSVAEAFKLIERNLLPGAVLSPIYRTAPRDVENQPDFINAACSGLYSGSACLLLKQINTIEELLGRNRALEQRRGPRPIDIDILLFGEYIINDEGLSSYGCKLIVPHERMNQRLFALAPVLSINPDLIDPVSRKRFADIAESVKDQLVELIDRSSPN